MYTTGSGTGKSRLLSGHYDFAGSDSQLSAEQRTECPECWFVPALAGAVAVVYHVPDFAGPLLIPREVLAGIFRGSVTKWSALAEWNTKLSGRDEPIVVCVRGEASGTTELFTTALASFSSEFAANPGANSLPNWPGDFRLHNDTSLLVRSTMLGQCSIGYASLADAKAWGAPVARISNSEGRFIAPTSQAVQAAMDAFVNTSANNGADGLDEREQWRLMYMNIVDPQQALLAYPIAGRPSISVCAVYASL